MCCPVPCFGCLGNLIDEIYKNKNTRLLLCLLLLQKFSKSLANVSVMRCPHTACKRYYSRLASVFPSKRLTTRRVIMALHWTSQCSHIPACSRYHKDHFTSLSFHTYEPSCVIFPFFLAMLVFSTSLNTQLLTLFLRCLT